MCTSEKYQRLENQETIFKRMRNQKKVFHLFLFRHENVEHINCEAKIMKKGAKESKYDEEP